MKTPITSPSLGFETLEGRLMMDADSGLAGDFDRDGTVTAGDLSVWQRQFGASVANAVTQDQLTADADKNGRVDGNDFLSWQRNVGTPAASFDLSEWQAQFGQSVASAVTAEELTADADRNGQVDGSDFLAWQRNLGAVDAAFTDTLTEEYEEIAQEHAAVFADLERRLEQIEAVPLDIGTAPQKAAVLADLFQDLQQQLAVVLDATLHSSEAEAEAARIAFEPLNQCIQDVCETWKKENDAVVALLELAAPKLVTADMDLKPDIEQSTVGYSRYSTYKLPDEIGGHAYIQSWQGGGVTSPSIDAASGDEAARPPVIRGNAITIDFRAAGSRVQGAELTVAAVNGSADIIDVHYFAGQREVGTGTIVPGGPAQLALPEGTTSLALVPRDLSVRSQGLRIDALKVTADVHAEPLAGPELSLMTNGLMAELAANPAWHAPMRSPNAQDYQRFLARNDLYRYRGGEEGITGGRFLLGWHLPPDKYHRITAMRSGDGYFAIQKVHYIDNWNTVQELSPAFYEIRGLDVIIAPGAPPRLVIEFRSSTNTIFDMCQGDTCESVEPITTMKPSVSMVKLDDQPSGQGWGERITMGESGRRPVIFFGSQFGATFNVTNNSPISGPVTIQIYAGATGTKNDQLQSTWTTTLGAYETRSLTVNVTAQGDNSMGLGRPQVLFVGRLADGTEFSDSAAVGQSNSMDGDRSLDSNGNFVYGPGRTLSVSEQRRLVTIATRGMESYEQRVANGTTYAFDEHVDFNQSVQIAMANYEAAKAAGAIEIVEEPGEEEAIEVASLTPEELEQYRAASELTGLQLDAFIKLIQGSTNGNSEKVLLDDGGGYAIFQKRSDGGVDIYFVDLIASNAMSGIDAVTHLSRPPAFVPAATVNAIAQGDPASTSLLERLGASLMGAFEKFIGKEPESNNLPIQSLRYEAKDFVGEVWDELSIEERQSLRGAFNFGDLEDLPKNKQLIGWLIDTFVKNDSLETHRMSFDRDRFEWSGSEYSEDDGPHGLGGQCKWWIDDVVANNALNIDITGNHKSDLGQYSWEPTEDFSVVSQSISSGITAEIINEIRPGDFIQITGAAFPPQHSLIVGAQDSEGLWVFDSNAINDKIPRYHRISFSTFELSASAYTVYRAK